MASDPAPGLWGLPALHQNMGMERGRGFLTRSCVFLGRFWLVIKEDGHMVTARQEPRLVLVSITYEGNRLILKAPGMDQLALPSELPSSNKLWDCRCSFWGRWGRAADAVSRRLLCAPVPPQCV